MAEGDVAERPALRDPGSLEKVPAGALHGAGLHHPVVLAGGLHHLGALVHIGASGLFDIDVLAGLARLDGDVGVPVVGSGDAHRVDQFVGDDVAKVLDRLYLIAPARGGRLGALERRLVNVAHRHRLKSAGIHGVAEVSGAHSADADKPDGDPVVGAQHAAGKQVGGNRGGARRFEKGAAIGVGVVVFGSHFGFHYIG